MNLTTGHRFSADTAPSNSLVHAGKNATVLIHEATMDNDQIEMAAQKAHSTFGQALHAGKRSVYPNNER
jgi:ribonuclease Z